MCIKIIRHTPLLCTFILWRRHNVFIRPTDFVFVNRLLSTKVYLLKIKVLYGKNELSYSLRSQNKGGPKSSDENQQLCQHPNLIHLEQKYLTMDWKNLILWKLDISIHFTNNNNRLKESKWKMKNLIKLFSIMNLSLLYLS